MDKNKMRQVREYLNKILEENPNDLGVNIEVANGSYSFSNGHFKITVADVSQDGTVHTREAEDFKTLGSYYGLDPEWLNKTFQYRGVEHKIVGYKSRSKKYPVLVEAEGKTYKFPVDLIKLNMNKGKPVTNHMVIGQEK